MTNKLELKARKLDAQYESIFGDVSKIIEAARRSVARSVNSVMTAAYWLIGRRIVEFEQSGEKRAEYGEKLIERLAGDLADRYGRGFSVRNVWQMKAFYLAWPIPQTTSAESSLVAIAGWFPLPWSAYVRLLSVKNENARAFYETEALRIGDEWYRVDLVFFHRKLRCLVIIDLKIGKFTHADAGQMHLYLNYAREHWVHEDENPPVGLILCARKDEAVAHYAFEGLPNKVMAAEYRTALPDEKTLAAEIRRTQEILRKREALALPPWEEIRVKKTAERKRGTKSTGGKRK